MSLLSATAMRTAVCVVALSGAGLWALWAMDAKADPPLLDDSSPCAEARVPRPAEAALNRVPGEPGFHSGPPPWGPSPF